MASRNCDIFTSDPRIALFWSILFSLNYIACCFCYLIYPVVSIFLPLSLSREYVMYLTLLGLNPVTLNYPFVFVFWEIFFEQPYLFVLKSTGISFITFHIAALQGFNVSWCYEMFNRTKGTKAMLFDGTLLKSLIVTCLFTRYMRFCIKIHWLIEL